jgi:hypothetical protein
MRKQTTGRKMKDRYGVENQWKKNNRKMDQVRIDIKNGQKKWLNIGMQTNRKGVVTRTIYSTS